MTAMGDDPWLRMTRIAMDSRWCSVIPDKAPEMASGEQMRDQRRMRG